MYHSHLCRGSHFKDRIFLSNREERSHIMALLRKEISFPDYLAENCRSLNGQLIRNLLERVTNNFNEEIVPSKILLKGMNFKKSQNHF